MAITHGKDNDCRTPVAGKCAFMSLRVPDSQWLREELFAEFMSLLERNHEAVDEIAFFLSAGIHPVLPLETVREYAETLRGRLKHAKAEGYRAGINFLSTIGHCDEYLSAALQGPFTRITALDGAKAGGSFCPNDDGFRKHLAAVYTALAQAEPDFIWIDDDMRLSNHRPAVRYGCFCDNCIRLFNEANGLSLSRNELAKAFDEGSTPEKLNIRNAWIECNSRTIANVLTFIERVVHGINPKIKLGLMTGERFYEGCDFDNWAGALAGAAKTPVMWRPGGGFYSDESMRALVSKGHAIGRQISLLPEMVVDIQSEIENFPYQPLKKSRHATAVETAVYMAAGCAGAAYNILGMFDESPGKYEPLLNHLAEKRPFFDLLHRVLGRNKPIGICQAWNKKSMASSHLSEGEWLDEPEWNSEFMKSVHEAPLELLELGLPAAYSSALAEVTLLSGDTPAVFSRAELETMFSRGVYMDGQALERLHTLGLGDLAGFKVVKWLEQDCAEILTDDIFNGKSAGTRRDCLQSFWPNPCASLAPLDSQARVLGRKTGRLRGTPDFPCMGVYENRLGGRVVVAGYAPWTYLQSSAKAQQLKRLFRWLSYDKLTGYVNSYHKVNLWLRKDASGNISAVVLNSSQDRAEGISISILTDKTALIVTDMDCKEVQIPSSGKNGGYTEFSLSPIAPWHMALMTV